MANRRSKAQQTRLPRIVEEIIKSPSLVKKGLMLGLLGIALAIVGETISSEGSTLFVMHIVFKYFGVSLFITCGVLLLIEKLPETIELGDLEEKMESHGNAIAEKNKDGRSQVIEEGTALAHESLQNLFDSEITKGVNDLLTNYLSIPIEGEAQRRITAWLLKNETLNHISNLARFASGAEAPRFDVPYLGSGPYFTAAVLTAHMKSLKEGDSYFSAGEIWFWLDAEATRDFIDEMRNACRRGVRIRRVFDLSSPPPFNLRLSSEDLEGKTDVVLERHRQLARDSHGMYEFVVFPKEAHDADSVKRYSVFSKHGARRQLVFRPQNQELGTFSLEYERNAENTEGTELLWQEAWQFQSKRTRLLAGLKRGYEACRRGLVGVQNRAPSFLVIILGLLLVYWSKHPVPPAGVEHGASLQNVDTHGDDVAAPESSPGSSAFHAISNAVPMIIPDLAYDVGIALQISGIAAMLVAPRRRKLDNATELASKEFKEFEKQREATTSARNYKSLGLTTHTGFLKLFEEASRMCVSVDDDKSKETFVDLVRELDALKEGESLDKDALQATAKWVLTDHLKTVFKSVNTFGKGALKQHGNYDFDPPNEVAVMEQLFGELIGHANRNDSLDSLIDFEYFIPTDTERFEMKKLREAVANGFKVRRIFHCTYHKYAQPAKSWVPDSDIRKIIRAHKRLQQQYPSHYQVKFLTDKIISRLKAQTSVYGIKDLNQYLQAALYLHNVSDPQAAPRIYYLNIKQASDEKQLSLEKTTSKDKRITFFNELWGKCKQKYDGPF